MSDLTCNRSLRVFYAAGPGYVIQTYQYWQQGLDDTTQMARTYSGQFFDVLERLQARGYLLSTNHRVLRLDGGFCQLEQRPVPFQHAANPLLHHWGQLWYGLQLIAAVLRFRADVAIVAQSSTHLFLLSILTWLGIEVIPLVQCVLWHKYGSPGPLKRFILGLSRPLLARDCLATIVVADEIGAQVRTIAGPQSRPILRVFPVYRREQFADLPAPDRARLPFRILFAGRIEASKGVFDLLAAAKQLLAEGVRDFCFDICGKGSSLDRLRETVAVAALDRYFYCHGHCNRERMAQLQAQSHVVIVPTRTDFIEGFAKAVVEGVLAGRPTVASRVCTDLEYFAGAVLPVEPNDAAGYAAAIRQLQTDADFYEGVRQKCLPLRESFYDPSRGWGAVLQQVLLNRFGPTGLAGSPVAADNSAPAPDAIGDTQVKNRR